MYNYWFNWDGSDIDFDEDIECEDEEDVRSRRDEYLNDYDKYGVNRSDFY